MNFKFQKLTVIALTTLLMICIKGQSFATDYMKWHKITLDFEGPHHSETDNNPNPFMDYKLDVTFTNGDKSYKVPGYFAADGNAAESSATDGNIWRVHFSPDELGEWEYLVSFRKGEAVAVENNHFAGKPVAGVDGLSGKFNVIASDKTGIDHRSKGLLKVTGGRYLQFAETGEYFLKAGADAPENLLSYQDFDGDFKSDGIKDNLVKTWEPHVRDWKTGDPTWQNSKGKGLIGALNYLSASGMNAFSFLTMNILGDDKNVYPYTSYDERWHMDVSKLDQWEIVFEHADKLGLFLHVKTQETENQGLLDNGDTGPQRKLYYRELIARFSHHLALNWNLGEENGVWKKKNITTPQTTAQRKAMAKYFADNDPYGHHIVIHNGQEFDDLLGTEVAVTGVSIQTNQKDFSRVHTEALKWVNKSKKAGKQWAVSVDEPGDAQHSLLTDDEDNLHNDARKNALWGTFMAGAFGIEWYFGYAHPHSDLSCEDWRTRDQMWKQSSYALNFFRESNIPFWEMESRDGFTQDQDDYCFMKEGKAYVIYQKQGEAFLLNLQNDSNKYKISWYNPRTGEYFKKVKKISGGKSVDVSAPPYDVGKDWVVLLKRI